MMIFNRFFRIFFTVVSDPMDEEDEECEDVGIAYVDLLQVYSLILISITPLSYKNQIC